MLPNLVLFIYCFLLDALISNAHIIENSNLSASAANESDRDDDSYSLNRRSSSGGLLSPEVDMAGHTSGKPGEASETDGFYMLKKDSQRRTTLSKVLSHDEAKICAVWMDKIENNHNVQLVITKVSYFRQLILI